MLLTPADDGQQLVRSLADFDLVLVNEVAIDAQGASRGFEQFLDLGEEVLSAVQIKTQGSVHFV